MKQVPIRLCYFDTSGNCDNLSKGILNRSRFVYSGRQNDRCDKMARQRRIESPPMTTTGGPTNERKINKVRRGLVKAGGREKDFSFIPTGGLRRS